MNEEFLKRFSQFLMAGSIGFIVDAGILLFLIETFYLGPAVARFISVPAAIVSTWVINRHVAFREKKSDHLIQEFFKYLLSNGLGLTINLATYLFLINEIPFFYDNPLFPLVIATGISLIFNYLSYNHFVFRK